MLPYLLRDLDPELDFHTRRLLSCGDFAQRRTLRKVLSQNRGRSGPKMGNNLRNSTSKITGKHVTGRRFASPRDQEIIRRLNIHYVHLRMASFLAKKKLLEEIKKI